MAKQKRLVFSRFFLISADRSRKYQRHLNMVQYKNILRTPIIIMPTSEALKHLVPEAHEQTTGRLDAQRLAAQLALSTAEMARIVGYTPRGLTKNPASARLQPRLVQIMALVQQLRDLLDGDINHVRIWLKAPHPDLGGRTPLSYLEQGRLDVVTGLIHALETGQPG